MNFIARITVEDEAGRKAVNWVPLPAETVGAAQEEFRTLLVQRSEDRLPHIGGCPQFSAYLHDTYLPRLQTLGKKPDTLVISNAVMSGIDSVTIARWLDTKTASSARCTAI